MGKALAVIFVLVFVLAACAAKEEPEPALDVVVPAPAAAPEPEPVQEEPEPGLLNYEEWFKLYPEDAPPPGFEIGLDSLVFSDVGDDGYTTTAVMFPRQWPAKQLEGTIPEYTGTGYMQEFFLTHPNMSLRTEDIESVKLSVYRYKDEDIKNYIDNLSGFTPDEEYAEEYYRDKAEYFPYIQAVKSFRKDEIILNIIFAEEDETVYRFLNSGKFLQFEVIYSREAYKFDPDAAEPTELLNFFEFAKEAGYEVPVEIVPDYLMDSYEGSGMSYRMISTPSKWPRDALGDLLPIYPGYGFMQKYEITTPQDDTSPENALLFTVSVITDDASDIEAYMRRVADFGYYELPPEAYTEYQKGLADERDFVRVFCLPAHTCVISTFEDANLPILDISLYFEGRRQNFFNAQASAEEQGAAQGSPPMA